MEPRIEKKLKLEDVPKPVEEVEKMLITDPVTLIQNSTQNQFGNYKEYYKNRNQNKFQDVRIHSLDSSYFENKDVLDIGCNDGTLSIILAIKYFPYKYIGIDIDHNLISQAVENFFQKQQKLCKPDILQNFDERIKQLPLSFQKKINRQELLKKQNNFPYNLHFKVENYVQSSNQDKYDTILCLSVVKWIHLNFGDDVLKGMFKKIHKYHKLFSQLNPGGVLIFEFQDWKSYKKRRNLCDVIHKNYKNIKLRPNNFILYLVEIGFQLIDKKQIQDSYKRDIYFLQKIEKTNQQDQ